jgi:hypothetical protein
MRLAACSITATKIRWIIEQVISHFKNWRIMNTDYRRPIDTFASTISAKLACTSIGCPE